MRISDWSSDVCSSDLYPDVSIRPERTLVISGDNEDLVSSGASTSWHDLVLYLVARYAGATDAQALARMFALQWHQEGLASYISFEGKTDHHRSEEHTSELQSLMRISSAVFCLQQNKRTHTQ